MKTAIVLVLAFVCAVSAHPHKCHSPQVFESMIQEFIPKLNVSIPLGKLSFDGENRRTRTVETLVSNKVPAYYDIIYLHRCKIAFVFNMQTKNCTRQKVDLPWKPVEIPAEAQYLGDAYVGSAGVPGGGLLVQTWTGNSTEQGGFSYMTTFTRHGCLPFTVSMYGKDIGISVANFFNIVLGISDPNVFHPPKECFQQGQVLPEDMPHIYQAVPNVEPVVEQTQQRSLFNRLMNGRGRL